MKIFAESPVGYHLIQGETPVTENVADQPPAKTFPRGLLIWLACISWKACLTTSGILLKGKAFTLL